MKRLLCLLSALLLAAPLLAAPATLLQPQSGERGLQMEVSAGRAWLLQPNGQRLRLPLRRGEVIEELVEFENGWAAAGGRAIGSRRELVVVLDGAAGVERLQRVPEQLGDLRVRPVPLASAGGLEGLAWLEGNSPTSFEVRVAEWTGAVWAPSARVSAARRGGQAGLVGTVLEDGRWLLVWSGSDGSGSELFWSMREAGRWTPPRRLAAPNRVPDVTPSLVRVPGGALLVWARRESSAYGLQAARFKAAWSAPRRLGPADAWSPRFAEVEDAGRFLVHRSAGGWTTVELDADGRELRRAEVAAERRDRPVLTPASGGISLRWQRTGGARQLRWEGPK